MMQLPLVGRGSVCGNAERSGLRAPDRNPKEQCASGCIAGTSAGHHVHWGGGDQAGLTLTSLQTGTLKIGSLFDFLPILFIKPPPPPPVLDSQPTSRSASALNSQDGILVQLPPFTSPASPALHQPFSNTVPRWATNGPLVCHRCLGEVILVRPLGDVSSQLAAHVPGQRWRS